MTMDLPAEHSSTTPRNDQENTRNSSADADDSAARNVHIVLQGKGGVGKTFIASLIAQYLLDCGGDVACLDTDPVNASLCAIEALAASSIPLLDQDRINVGALDDMIERILAHDCDFVIDNGAASFLPLSRYLLENGIPDLIAEHGKRLVVHTVITGGPALVDTGKALAAILRQFPAEVRVVVWLNAFFGPVVTQAGDPFEATPLYRTHRERIAGLVRLDALDPDSYGQSLAQMRDRRLTFAEAMVSPDIRIVARRRLQQIRQRIWAQLAQVI